MSASATEIHAFEATSPEEAREQARLAEIILIQYRDAITLTILFVAAILLIGFSFYTPANIAPPTPIRTGVDPNTAAWYEFAQLPGIGEGVAKKIVAYRESRKSKLNSELPLFQRPFDLLPVKGIGTRMLQRMSPFLSFPPSPPRVDSPSDRR